MKYPLLIQVWYLYNRVAKENSYNMYIIWCPFDLQTYSVMYTCIHTLNRDEMSKAYISAIYFYYSISSW